MPESSDRTGKGLRFPQGFVWGVATAAYQVEGAVHEDGRGRSIWDTFSHTPGKVRHGDTGDIACDSYHLVERDLDLLSELGVGAYRFSIAWPRILPSGSGPVNQAGLDHYRRLVESLLDRDIAPVVTLYHWDLPQPLEDGGGWASRDTAARLADLAAVVATALGDGVSRWITVNEPWVVANLGYRWGIHAPGRKEDAAASAATHHLLLGHGLALAALRAELPPGTPVGVTLNMTVVRAADERARAAAEQVETFHNWVYLDPLITGSYPSDLPAEQLPAPQLIRDGDLATISAPIDFLGVNYYSPETVGFRAPGEELRRGEDWRSDSMPGIVTVVGEGVARTATGWPIDAEGLYELLLMLHKRAPGLPLYITENGMAADDYLDPEGAVDDEERIAYLRDHLAAAARAIADGVELRGYFCWSLLDNFEWAEGYSKRFGLVFVDYATQRRTPKASAAFYSHVVRSNALPAS
ncbi:MAG TPA: GH1 family beta-glucosidase [Acidimicrobiales bacterium]|nr:GH1 family beta-glucosidase [Acidimicrobiales bacterium]